MCDRNVTDEINHKNHVCCVSDLFSYSYKLTVVALTFLLFLNEKTLVSRHVLLI